MSLGHRFNIQECQRQEHEAGISCLLTLSPFEYSELSPVPYTQLLPNQGSQRPDWFCECRWGLGLCEHSWAALVWMVSAWSQLCFCPGRLGGWRWRPGRNPCLPHTPFSPPEEERPRKQLNRYYSFAGLLGGEGLLLLSWGCIIKHHQLCSMNLKQQTFILSQLWRPKVWNQGRPVCLLKVQGRILPVSFRSQWLQYPWACGHIPSISAFAFVFTWPSLLCLCLSSSDFYKDNHDWLDKSEWSLHIEILKLITSE